MTPGGAPAPVEIRPVPQQSRPVPADSAVLRKWLLRAEPADGTLVFTEDRPLVITPARTFTLPLPSTGRQDAVRVICLVSYRWVKNLQTGITWRLLFLDHERRVLGAGRRRDEPKASQMWPARIFTPLESLGISVIQESYPDPGAFQRAHPGVRLLCLAQGQARTKRA